MESPLNNEQAARVLGISPTTLAHLRAAGRGPSFYRVGRAVRYRASDIEAFQSANLVNLAPEA